jgi:hypothetical protein
MKLWFGIIGLLLCTFFLLGMGNMEPTEKPGEIPLPDKDISVTLTDSEGQVLSLSQFSVNGQIYLTGKLGAGQAAIPFAQIRTITVSAEGKTTAARLEMVDHSTLNVQIEKGATITGKMKFGTYKIPAERVKKIEILGVADRKK